jgi:hypothetical protein
MLPLRGGSFHLIVTAKRQAIESPILERVVGNTETVLIWREIAITLIDPSGGVLSVIADFNSYEACAYGESNDANVLAASWRTDAHSGLLLKAFSHQRCDGICSIDLINWFSNCPFCRAAHLGKPSGQSPMRWMLDPQFLWTKPDIPARIAIERLRTGLAVSDHA